MREGALQGCVLLQGDHPEGGVLRWPHLGIGGGQDQPLLDEEVCQEWENASLIVGLESLWDCIYLHALNSYVGKYKCVKDVCIVLATCSWACYSTTNTDTSEYLNIFYWTLDNWVQILIFSPTNIFGYSKIFCRNILIYNNKYFYKLNVFHAMKLFQAAF